MKENLEKEVELLKSEIVTLLQQKNYRDDIYFSQSYSFSIKDSCCKIDYISAENLLFGTRFHQERSFEVHVTFGNNPEVTVKIAGEVQKDPHVIIGPLNDLRNKLKIITKKV